MIELHTLGGIELRRSSAEALDSLTSQPKRLALLAYLALAERSDFRRRDVTVALLWPELDAQHARGSLRQALHFLRRSLGDGVIAVRGEEEIGVHRAAISCDAVEFLRCSDAKEYERALALYRGDFLDGFFVSDVAPEFEQWIADTRSELRTRAASCARVLSETRRATGDLGEAVAFARHVVALNPDDEGDIRRLIALLDESGDRAGALETYESLVQRLRADYDAEPSPETQALIRAVRTRRVTRGCAAATSPDVSPSPLAAPAARPRRLPWRLGIVVIVAVVAIALVAHTPAGDVPVTVAVIPLEDLSGDTSRTYVADGLTDQLITDLAQLGTLRVINRRTMMTYRGSRKTPADVARELNAGVVLFGSLQALGDTMRMTVQLVASGDDQSAWAQTFEGTRGDLLRMQREAARAAANRIRGVFPRTARGVMADSRPLDPQALDAYVKGRYYWNERRPQSLLHSIGLFEEALDTDPTFALAYSAMADAYVQLGYSNALEPGDAFPKARAAATGALALDSSLAEPHAALGFVHLYYDFDWPAAELEFRRAIAMNPSYSTAHEWYGLFLAAMGRFGEAEAEERRAQELEPLSIAIAGTTGFVLYYAGDVENARRELRIALRSDTTFPLGHFYLGRVYQQTGAADSALAQYRATGSLRGWVPTIVAEGHLLGTLGRASEATAVLARLDTLSRSQYVTAYGVALVHAALNRPDSAFAWLDRAYAERTNWMVWLNRDPRWAPIRSDPRFAALTTRMRLPK
jgi:DNA-binding SARP family transcriptional activator/TolB-like protein/Tfp pilus assembly protein PilF